MGSSENEVRNDKSKFRKEGKSKYCFWKLRGGPIDWGGDRRIMPISQESRQGDINKVIPPNMGGDSEAQESAIPVKTAQIWKIRSWFIDGNLRRRMPKWGKGRSFRGIGN